MYINVNEVFFSFVCLSYDVVFLLFCFLFFFGIFKLYNTVRQSTTKPSDGIVLFLSIVSILDVQFFIQLEVQREYSSFSKRPQHSQPFSDDFEIRITTDQTESQEVQSCEENIPKLADTDNIAFRNSQLDAPVSQLQIYFFTRKSTFSFLCPKIGYFPPAFQG